VANEGLCCENKKGKMNEHPILFSSEMVRAILDDLKTQTRRVIKPQPDFDAAKMLFPILWKDNRGGELKELFYDNRWAYDGNSSCKIYRCLYGCVGDKLWVKEKYAFGGNGVFYSDSSDGTVNIKWMSGRFMPKKFARIWLEITGIGVERLQDISVQDCFAEGVNIQQSSHAQPFYKALWDSINAKRGFGWETNPPVWVIEFKRTE
jgi:hypothetical protein